MMYNILFVSSQDASKNGGYQLSSLSKLMLKP